MSERETCDDCGGEVNERDVETLQEGTVKRYLCEDCYLDRRSKAGRP